MRYSTKILWIFYSCEKGLIIAIKIIPINFLFAMYSSFDSEFGTSDATKSKDFYYSNEYVQ